jgi:hypothetical protein
LRYSIKCQLYILLCTMKNHVYKVYTSMQVEYIKLQETTFCPFEFWIASDLRTCNLRLYPKHELFETMFTFELVSN